MSNKIILDREKLEGQYLNTNNNLKEIARYFNCSQPTISNLINEYQIPRKKNKFSPPKNKFINDYTIKNLKLREMARKYGVQHDTIKRKLKYFKIQTKSRQDVMEKHLKKDYKKLTPEKAYILGVLCSDGVLYKTGMALNGIQKRDIDFLKTFSKYIEKIYGFNGKIIKSWKNHNNRLSFYSYSIRLAKDLNRYGNFKTHTWNVPKQIKKSNEKTIGYFLRGLFDGDGTICRCGESRVIALYSSNKKGLLEVQRLLYKLKIRMKMYKNNNNIYYLRTGNQYNIMEFSNKIGFNIERKKNKLNFILNTYKYSLHKQKIQNKIYWQQSQATRRMQIHGQIQKGVDVV